MASRHRLYVGVDYGTTFSGFAYVTSSDSSIQNIEVITDWPGKTAGHLEKVPSQIAYQAENEKLDKDTWGYEIPSNARRHCWTKLRLDEHTRSHQFDDPSLAQDSEWNGMPLPKGKVPEDVVADYLAYLYKHCMQSLAKRMSEKILKVTPIEFWFTMPAIWSDEAQYATKAAAERAGFGERENDRINMIREPEAAALSALKITATRFDDLLMPNTGILVVDCGGGTVDITSYTIVATKPTLELEESCVGNGGKCGATYVDRNFVRLMTERYGEHYTSLPIHKRGPGSPFMKQFEDIRNDFDGTNYNSVGLTLIMKDLEEGSPNCVHYDPDDSEVTLTTKEIKAFFDPVISSIIGLIEQQKAAIAKENAPALKDLVLVGGFGSSPYVWKMIKAWCKKHDIRPICPDRPWSAIARGAVLRGFEGAIVTTRKCRRHYGLELGRPYRAGIDPRDARLFSDPATGQEYRAGWMDWAIRKGTKLYPGQKKSIAFKRTYKKGDPTVFTMDLFCSSFDTPPLRDDEPNSHVEVVGTVRVRLTEADLSKFPKKKARKEDRFFSKDTWYIVDMICDVCVADEVGVLNFVVTCQGQPCGTAELVFARE